jgi:hypothetical protein
MAIGALIAGAAGAIGGLFGGGGDIEIPPPPDPASFYSFEFDSEGNPVEGGSYVWNKSTNSYTWKPRALSQKEVGEMRLRSDMKMRLLSELNVTPEQRLKQYEEYAKTFSDFIHKDVDLRFAERRQSEAEELSRRGLFGSELAREERARTREEKERSDIDIAQRAFLAKEDIAERDRLANIQGLQVLKDLESAEFGQRATTQQLGMQGASSANQFLLDAYRSSIGAAQTKAQLEAQKRQNIFNTITGLSYLAGMAIPGKKTTEPTTPTVTPTISGSGGIFRETTEQDEITRLFTGG